MPTLQYMPPWTIDYSYKTDPSVIRTPDLGGYRRQSKVSNKRIITASARRVLQGSELLYFEWFLRGVLSDASLKFEDYYADHTGLNTGTIRIVDGIYEVSTNKRSHVVTCDIEIFR